ncbi:MAG: peptidylprolyl isomerase [Saprospiraceae bacterium]|nr:peptidylprolyl isomerase [Saprospiraceae bacterium]
MSVRVCLSIFAVGLVACSAPKAGFQLTGDSNVAPVEVAFTNTSEQAETYLWEFGDGTTSTEPSPKHRYRRSGAYTVRLKARKGNKENESTETIMINAPKTCLVEIETDHGRMLVELFDDTPLHRDNFLKLAEENFYDGLIFHRVIEGFMIQGGDPNSRNAEPGTPLGTGGPGYQIPAEITEHHVHLKGALAAARTGDAVNPERKSSGSQFYIVQGSPVPEHVLSMVEARSGIQYSPEQRAQYAELGGTPHLDMAYTVFGRVIEGLDVIDKLAGVRTGPRDRPLEDISMKVHVIK